MCIQFRILSHPHNSISYSQKIHNSKKITGGVKYERKAKGKGLAFAVVIICSLEDFSKVIHVRK